MSADSTASPWTHAAESGADAPDYAALYAALAATAQGRWFLAQHADRSRQAVTTQVLTAIDRLKHEVAGAQPPARAAAEPRPSGPGLDRLRDGLGGLAAALTAVQAELGEIEPRDAAKEHQSILAATEVLQEIAWFMRERGIESWLCDRLDGVSAAIRAGCAVPDLNAPRTRAIAGALAEVEKRLRAFRADLDQEAEAVGLFGEPPVPAANANLPISAPPMADWSEAGMPETETQETAGLETEALETAAVNTDSLGTEALGTAALETEAPAAEARETAALEAKALDTEAREIAALEAEALETETPAVEAPETGAPETEALKIPETTTPDTNGPETGTSAEVSTAATARVEAATENLAIEPAVETLVAEIAALTLVSGELVPPETTQPAAVAADDQPAAVAADDNAKPDESASTAAEAGRRQAEPEGESVRGRPENSSGPAVFAEVETAPASEPKSSSATTRALAAADWELPQPDAGDSDQPPPSPRLSHLLMAAELDRLLASQATSRPDPGVATAPDGDESSATVAAIDSAGTEATVPASVEAPLFQTPPVDGAIARAAETRFADPSGSFPATEIGATAVGATAGEAAVEGPATNDSTEQMPPPPAPPPPRPALDEAAELAKVDLAAFADVMALSDEERIALFT